MRVTDLAARVGMTKQALGEFVESAIGDIERRWAAEVGPERWATFREVLGRIGA